MPKASCKKRSFVDALHDTTSKKKKYTAPGAASKAEVNIFVSEETAAHVAVDIDNDSAKEHVVSPGHCLGLKFKDCGDIASLLNEKNKEAACRFADGFDTMVDVPRIMNVDVLTETFPNKCKPQLRGPKTLSPQYIVDMPFAEVGEEGKDVKVMRQGYVFGNVTADRGVPMHSIDDIESKMGRDFFTVITTKYGMKSLLNVMNDKEYFKEIYGKKLTKLDWVDICRTASPAPIWSEYYTWVVDGFQSYAAHQDPQDGEGGAYKWWADGISKVEIGHYEKERHNINDYLCASVPNDFYADGVVLGVIQPDQTAPGYMDGFNLKLDIEYKKVKVKYGAVYLNSLKGVHDLVTNLKNVEKSEFYRDGNKALSTSNDRPGDKITAFVHGGLEVYGVDMLNLWRKDDGTLGGYSDHGVFAPDSLFEENDIIPEFDSTKN